MIYIVLVFTVLIQFANARDRKRTLREQAAYIDDLEAEIRSLENDIQRRDIELIKLQMREAKQCEKI